MLQELGPSLRLTVASFVLCGLAYPLAMTGAAWALMPHQAGGSLIVSTSGQTVGSALVGQKFEGPGWFQGRVSAIAYHAEASGASNLGPTSAGLMNRVRQDTAHFRRANPASGRQSLPVDMFTQSASGLDPDITPAAARFQAPRVARHRRLPEKIVLDLIDAQTQGRDWALFGEPRVNVLKLNLALEAASLR